MRCYKCSPTETLLWRFLQKFCLVSSEKKIYSGKLKLNFFTPSLIKCNWQKHRPYIKIPYITLFLHYNTFILFYFYIRIPFFLHYDTFILFNFYIRIPSYYFIFTLEYLLSTLLIITLFLLFFSTQKSLRYIVITLF